MFTHCNFYDIFEKCNLTMIVQNAYLEAQWKVKGKCWDNKKCTTKTFQVPHGT